MDDRMQAEMMDATRLTRQGRLAEATARIQRMLQATPSATAHPGTTTAQIDGTFSVVEEGQSAPNAPQAPARRTATTTTPPPPALHQRVAGVLEQAFTRMNMDVHTRGAAGRISVPSAAARVSTSPPNRTPRTQPVGGQFTAHTYTNHAGTRHYKLYVPRAYQGQAVPLIVMLHGCTQTPDDFAAGTRMNMLAEAMTFLVAYPAQASAANRSMCWNWFEPADQQREHGEPALLAGITRQIMRDYHVADDRVYIAGLSAGGAMAVIMGTLYPDLYAAIGVHSGLAYGAAHDLRSAWAAMRHGGANVDTQRDQRSPIPDVHDGIVPTIMFHGDRDTTVHPRNADQIRSQRLAQRKTREQNTSDHSAPYVRMCQGQVSNGHRYTCTTYDDGNGRTMLEQWTIHGGGHAWSGGSSQGSYTDPNGPDATAEMVRFFHEHPQL